MKITSRDMAATTKPHHNQLPALWDNPGISSVTLDGTTYEFVREPEPVVMFTEFELNQHMMRLAKTSGIPAGAAVEFCNLILARRTAMLRVMGSEELVDAVVDETGLCVGDPSAENVIALITEHIEANRPELTDEAIDQIWNETIGVRAFAYRAAEYRSPTVAELRAENERLKKDREEGNADYLKLRDISDGHEVAYHKCRRLLESASKPQPVDDSDEYGILVQDGCVAIMHRPEKNWQWSAMAKISGNWFGYEHLDPTRIFKVTSQPRGPLRVPSDADIQEQEDGVAYGARALVGAHWAIDWIKKANGAK